MGKAKTAVELAPDLGAIEVAIDEVPLSVYWVPKPVRGARALSERLRSLIERGFPSTRMGPLSAHRAIVLGRDFLPYLDGLCNATEDDTLRREIYDLIMVFAHWGAVELRLMTSEESGRSDAWFNDRMAIADGLIPRGSE